MTERVAVASRSSEPHGPALRQAVIPRSVGAGVERMLDLQQGAGNIAARLMVPQLGRTSARPLRSPSRDETRAGFTALRRAVVARRTLAREGAPDPGPPQTPDVTGLSCGIKDGKLTCTVSTPKGDVDVDTSTFTPSERKAAVDPRRPKNCSLTRWNWYWQSCCAPGTHFDDGSNSCRPDARPKEEPFVIPPAPPEEKGDFPLPDESQAYA